MNSTTAIEISIEHQVVKKSLLKTKELTSMLYTLEDTETPSFIVMLHSISQEMDQFSKPLMLMIQPLPKMSTGLLLALTTNSMFR